ncbi:type II toxin-antitoxin system VapC family toxin [Thermodesulfobacteriota bacterium]
MSRLLLDTHIFLWSLLDPERLSANITTELESSDNAIWISPITTWEVIILAEKGRLKLDDEPVTWMKNVLQSLPFRQATLNHEVAMKSRKIHLPHQDPADRFIVASAMVYDLTLVTSDKILIQSAKYVSILPNQ